MRKPRNKKPSELIRFKLYRFRRMQYDSFLRDFLKDWNFERLNPEE